MIQVTVNNILRQIETDSALEQLIKELDIDTHGCAIAVNDQIVPRTEWSTFVVKNDMSINIFQAIAGG
ncbi:sulfur carrier protein ThiS [Vibrio hangzhouensis]|uniref:Sulfur carrier protein n=1 Tax=Vibrio hangzhouensis TaxID=462991 RepID=A0A1H6CQP8_9VIBR|nr:sulfur carrier protein ThiS [Vibrio hangzhouensis]SEG74955.1 sulfur carrier protein [Vibrio hangzhouensis]